MTNLNGGTLYEMRYLGRAFIGCRKASGQFIDEWLQEKEHEEARLSKEWHPGKRRESTYLMITNPKRTLDTVHRTLDTVSTVTVNTANVVNTGSTANFVHTVQMRPRIRHASADELRSSEVARNKMHTNHHAEELASPGEPEDGTMMDDILFNLPGLFQKEKKYVGSTLKRRVTLINVTDTNRIMLLQTQIDRLSFISLDKKTVILEKLFIEISYCAQGCRHRDHFAFVCRDGRTQKLVMYMFQCSSEAAVDQILQTLRAALAMLPDHDAKALSPTQPLANGDVLATAAPAAAVASCDMCPLVQLQKLKAKLDSLADAEARYGVLHDCISHLPQRTYKEMMSKMKSEECQDFAEKNEVLITKLTILCQLRQLDHHCPTHGIESSGQEQQFQLLTSPETSSLPRSPNILKALREKAKKALTHRFSKKTAVSRMASDGGQLTMRPVHRELSLEFLNEETKTADEAPQGHRRRSVTWGAGSILDLKDGTIVTVPHRATDLPSPTSPSVTPASVHRRAGLLFHDSSSEQEPQLSPVGEANASAATDARFEFPSKADNASPGSEPLASSGQTEANSVASATEEIGNHKKLTRAKSSSKKSRRENIRQLWKRASEQAILLGRLERENRSLEESTLRRQQLDYKEVTSCSKNAMRTWTALLKRDKATNNNIVRVDKVALRSAVIEGVPHTGRGEIWPFLIEQYMLEHRKSASEAEQMLPPASMYKAILEEFTPERHAILIDLGRTFPSHPYFQSQLGAGQISLFNILKAYSLLDKEVGYCQGLCFIAGIILLHLSEDGAFHILKHIMLVLDMRQQYKPEMDAMQLKAYQLSRLLSNHHNDLYQHFQKHSVDPSLYATPWFMTLFASEFPIGFAVRVFDFLLLEGPGMIFSISLSLLAKQKQELLQANTLEDIVKCLKTTLPAMDVQWMDSVFASAVDMDLTTELAAYEREYLESKSRLCPSSSPKDKAGRLPTPTEDRAIAPPSRSDSSDGSPQEQLATLRRRVDEQKRRSAEQAAVIETLQKSHFELAECVRQAERERDVYRRAAARLASSAPAELWALVECELSAAGVPSGVSSTMRAGYPAYESEVSRAVATIASAGTCKQADLLEVDQRLGRTSF